MAKEMTIAAALHKHVFGPDDPSDMLVDAGRFPMGWVKEYRRLLRLVEVEWLSEPLWPRDLVVALYYVATHLELRYKTWRTMEGGEKADEETERELREVLAPTRLFFAKAFPADSMAGGR